jgi:ABC-type transport system substrate-binding protein/DNA-binding SARP family transcriptional activator
MGHRQDARHHGSPPALDLRILGPLEAWRGEQRLGLGGGRQRSVLACLLLSVGHDVPTDRIVDSVWGERPPNGVLSTLQTYVFHLREVLEPPRARGDAPSVIVTVPNGYRFETTAATVDAARFEELVVAGRTALATDPATAADQLGQGLALWRGPVLADLPALDEVVSPVAARLDDLRVVATELWAEAKLALGDDGVLTTLDGLIATYPLREHLAALRMLALYRAGRQADALAAYRQLRVTLRDELGIQPSTEVETMHQRVLRQDPGLDLVRPVITPTRRLETPVEPSPASPSQPVDHRQRRAAPFRGLSRRVWASVAAIVVVAGVALVWWTFVARRASVNPLPANSVGPVDAQGLRGDAAVLDSSPSALVSAAGAIWAVMENADAVVKIDPHSRSVVTTVRGVGGTPQALAVSGDDLWVAGYAESVLTRINIPTGIVVRKIQVGIEPSAVVAGPDGVWVANTGDNTVQHVSPATEKADPPVAVGDGPDALALDGSTLWVANGRAGTVTRLETRTGQPIAEDLRVDAGPAALAVTGTDVWVANEFGQSVSRVSRSTGRVQRIEVADGPSSMALVGDEVWVTNFYGGSLSRIDVSTNEVREQPVGGGAPRAITVIDGEVWVSAGAYADPGHRGGTLIWEGTTKADFEQFDPATGGTPDYGMLGRSVYDGLVAYRLNGGRDAFGLVPDLATNIPVPTDGGRTYRFSIRPGIRYSTGAVVRPSDFVRGMQRALHPVTGNEISFAAVIGADSCMSPSDGTDKCDLSRGMVPEDANGLLTIHLSRPDPELLYKLTLLVVPTPEGTPRGRLESESLPGTGPYQVANVDRGNVTLTRNPYFSQWSRAAQPEGFPDVIAYKVGLPDAAVAADVLDGRAQGGWPRQLLPIISSKPAFVRPYDLTDVQYIFTNAAQPPFHDVRVRQALSYAIDRRRIAELGDAVPTCQLVPASFPGFRPYCPHQSGPADGPYQGPDVGRARALVAESGTAGANIIVYHGTFLPVLADIGRYVASVLTDLGYRVELRPIPDKDWGDPFFDTTQVVIPIGWVADYLTPGTFYGFVADCEKSNPSHYCNPTIQARATEARTLARTDPAAALAAWAQVDRMLVDDAAMIPTHSLNGTVLVSPSVGNVIMRPGYGPILHQLWVQ